jgi:hypothetical protein
MTKEELIIAVEKAKTNTREALQLVFNELNNGQQKKLLKNEEVKALFDLYGVEYEA